MSDCLGADDEAEDKKRPAFQWYPADWKKDLGVQACSIGARGLWLEMLGIMHWARPYGYLVLNGQPLNDESAARMCGVELKDYRTLLAELETAGVPSRTPESVLFSRRLVRDERNRLARASGGPKGAEHGSKGAEHGSKGGRPSHHKGGLQPTQKPPLSVVDPPNKEPPLEPGLKPPPAFALAVASAVAKDLTSLVPPDPSIAKRGERLPREWLLPPPWKAKALLERSDWTEEHVEKAALSFHRYWIAKPGKDATKLDWESTFLNYVAQAKTPVLLPDKTPVEKLAKWDDEEWLREMCGRFQVRIPEGKTVFDMKGELAECMREHNAKARLAK